MYSVYSANLLFMGDSCRIMVVVVIEIAVAVEVVAGLEGAGAEVGVGLAVDARGTPNRCPSLRTICDFRGIGTTVPYKLSHQSTCELYSVYSMYSICSVV